MSGSGRKKVDMSTYLTDDEDPEFQIAPMIDVLLVLLIFFMSITTTDVLQKDQFITLAEAANSKKPDKKTNTGQAIVNIGWDTGAKTAVFKIDQTVYPVTYLVQELGNRKAINDKMNPGSKFRVIVRADKDVQYRYTQDVMRACGAVGISELTFSVIQVGAYTRGGTEGR